MQIDLKNLVSISEANRDFLKVARMVDENGAAVILKNDAPRYVLIDYSKLQEDVEADDKALEDAAVRLLQKHRRAFEELGK